MRKFNFLIALPHPQNSDRTPTSSTSDRTPHIPKKRFLRSASLSHPLNTPNSDRTPTPQKRSHPHTPKTAIAHPPNPQTAIPTERFAIAFPTSLKTAIALPTSQKRSHSHTLKAIALPTSQTAIALPHSQKRSHPTFPKAIAPHIPKSDRTPTSQTAIPTERFAIAPQHPKKRSLSHTAVIFTKIYFLIFKMG